MSQIPSRSSGKNNRASINQKKFILSNGCWIYQDKNGGSIILNKLVGQSHWNVNALSEMLGLTPREFRIYFERSFGIIPKKWLRHERISTAMHLLREGEKIEVVSLKLGFKDASDFSKEFRALVHVTPSYYVRSELSRAFPNQSLRHN